MVSGRQIEAHSKFCALLRARVLRCADARASACVQSLRPRARGCAYAGASVTRGFNSFDVVVKISHYNNIIVIVLSL